MKRKTTQETFLLVVQKGALVPCDGYTADRLSGELF